MIDELVEVTTGDDQSKRFISKVSKIMHGLPELTDEEKRDLWHELPHNA
jgi:hypothetical protein